MSENLPSRTATAERARPSSAGVSDASVEPMISDGPLSLVLDAVDAAIITIESDGTIGEVNDATTRMLGHARKMMIGRNVNMLMPEPWHHAHDGYLAHHLKTGERRIIGKGRNVEALHANGSRIPVHLAVGRHESDGRTRFTGVLRNLTVQERNDVEALRLGRIVNASINEIYAFDAQTLKFTLVNASALENLGYTAKQMRSMTPVDIKPLLDTVSFRRLLDPLRERRRDRVRFATEHQRADGTRYQVEIALQWSDQTVPPEFVAIVQDVTERNRLERAFHDVQRLESIGELSGGIAHDFNNLLTVIGGNLELLQGRLNDKLSQELLCEARDATNVGARLTARLLAYASRSRLEPETVDANVVLLTLRDLLRRSLGPHIALDTVLQPGLWPVHVDVSQLENALMNLAVNARDAMSPGGRLTVRTRNLQTDTGDESSQTWNSTAEVALADRWIAIEVSDTGSGIAAANLPHVFEPFFTTRVRSGDGSGSGSGLGLSMVFGFARQSGGRVEAWSEPGQGSRFTMLLPAAATSTHACLSSELLTGDKPPGLAPERLRVLVVEDDPGVRRLALKRLTQLGHDTIEAASGEEALALFRSGEWFDLLFTDMVMGGALSGRALAHALLAERPDLPVLLTTGYAEELLDNVEHTERLPMLAKPYGLEELESAIRVVIESPRASTHRDGPPG